MTAGQFNIVITCSVAVVMLMVTMVGILFRIAAGWSTTKHEISDLREDFAKFVEGNFDKRLSRIEWVLEGMTSGAVRSEETTRGRSLGSGEYGLGKTEG